MAIDAGEYPAPAATRELISTRLAAGLIQGLVLYVLFRSAVAPVWPATNAQVFVPLLFVAVASPLVFILGFGNLRRRTLLLWLAGATVLVAFLAWYGVWHRWPAEREGVSSGLSAVLQVVPMSRLVVGTAIMLFIAHALIAGGDQDRRIRAVYTTHFDVSWKLAVQLALAFIFVLVFWALLWLGAGLFNLVRLDFFRRLIAHSWFAIPVTASAFAAALHVTDVSPALVRGVRTLVLMLLSWLLPLMTVIAVGFLAALLFTGLTPLWQTRFAAGLLLISSGALIVLVNAAYREGGAERKVALPFRLGGSAAALALVPLSVLAAYALFLRVRQYGWTVDRVALAACVAVALVYAGGYAFAIMRKGAWLRFLELWNFAAALFVLAVLFAYFSPIADPARLSVASQMARLESGKVSPRKFDYAYLRFRGGRFGKAALDELYERQGSDADYVSRRIEALRSGTRSVAEMEAPDLALTIKVYPEGRGLPASFLDHQWRSETDVLPNCLRMTSASCNAYLIDLDGDGREEIVLLAQGAYGNSVFAEMADGQWQRTGAPDWRWNCPSIQHALQLGRFDLVASAPPRWRDVEVGGMRLNVRPPEEIGVRRCPQ